MIIERVLTNIKDLDKQEIETRHLEKVYLASSDLVKRIQRVTTDHQRELGISLSERKDLTDGDVLYMDEQNIIVISVIPEELLVIRPRSIREMGEIAHKLGNRHLPAQFEDDTMLIQYDYLVEEVLQQEKIPYSREKLKVEKAFRHVGHQH